MGKKKNWKEAFIALYPQSRIHSFFPEAKSSSIFLVEAAFAVPLLSISPIFSQPPPVQI